MTRKKSTSKKSSAIRIGFDFDKVLVDYPPLVPDAFINWIYKKKSKTLVYRFPNKFEQMLRIATHYPLFRHPIWVNVSKVKELAEKNNIPLYLISGRFGFLNKRTERWLQKFPLKQYFQAVHFNFENKQPHIHKDQLIKKLKITHFIDDDLDLLLYLAKENPEVQFYWLNNDKLTKRFIPFDNIRIIETLQDLPKL